MKASAKRNLLNLLLGSTIFTSFLATRARGLEGKVHDLSTEEPIKDAKVSVVIDNDTLATTYTDSTGHYKLHNPILQTQPQTLKFNPPEDTLKTVYIKNNGIGKLSWHLQEDVDWLDVAPDTGSTLAETDTVEVAIDKQGLEPGDYQTQIFVNSDGGTDTVKVNMQVVGINEETVKELNPNLDFKTYPNPVSTSTPINFSFNLKEKGPVNLYVYDMLGRRVKTLINNKEHDAGFHTYQESSNLSSGIYFYYLGTKQGNESKKVVVIGSQGTSRGSLLEKLSKDNGNNQGLSSRLSFNENEKRTLSSQLLNTDNDSTYLQLVIDKDGYHLRETWTTRADTLRNETLVDTLPREGFLGDIGRSGPTDPQSPLVRMTHRLIQQPEFYISLVKRDTSGNWSETLSVDDWRIKLVDSIIRYDLPRLTKIFGKDSSFVYEPVVTRGTDPPAHDAESLKGKILVEYDDSVIAGTVKYYENEAIIGACVSNTSTEIQNSRQIWLHEFFHAFGAHDLYNTPPIDSSIMEGGVEDYTRYDLTAGKFLYNRPVGNQAPDKDPLPSTYGKKGKGSTIYTITYKDPFSF